MEPLSSLLPPAWAVGLPLAASIPLGVYMARVLNPPPDRVGRGIDAPAALLCRAFGRKAPVAMGWRAYAAAMLVFNAMLFALSFLVLLVQNHLPFNPDGKGPLTGDAATGDTAVIFNTICSFVTNTNLQHYSGEQALSYFSQLGAVVWLQFVTPACGLAVMLAVIRGLRGDEHLGDFYYDLSRSLVHVLIPLSLVVAIVLAATGMPMTFAGAAKAKTLEGAEQTIARGPVAAQVAIKQLGTNGGGFFGPNSTHPFENPSPWSSIVEATSIILLPMACIVMFGVMLRNRAHATVVFSVMMAMLLTGVVLAIWAENQPSVAVKGLPVAAGPNMEGKEVRLGAPAAATWAAMTTATSNGSVNSMHDSFQPLGGVVPMALMMLNVDFSGVGAGFLNMLMYILVAVFIAGLMVGRTPEYLGKKVEAKEVKLAMVALLIHPFLICVGAGLFAAVPSWAATAPNPGPHGFSEILYEFTSASANNGSGFEGLGDNVPSWNIATGIVLLLGRYPALILPLAIAGSLSGKKRVPQTSGTLRTNTPTFAFMLLGTVLLVGALSFMPAVVLGPIADALTGAKP